MKDKDRKETKDKQAKKEMQHGLTKLNLGYLKIDSKSIKNNAKISRLIP